MARNSKSRRKTVPIDPKVWQGILSLAAGDETKANAIIDEALRTHLSRADKKPEGASDLSSVPYGFRIVGADFEKHMGEYGIVQKIMQLQQKGRTLDQIALRLNDSRYRTRSKEKWVPQTIEDALRSYREQVRRNAMKLNRRPADR